MNPYSPPGARVADIVPLPPASWGTVGLSVIGFSALALFVAWKIVPIIVAMIIIRMGAFSDASGIMTVHLVIDMVLSIAAFAICCYFAGRVARGRIWWAALGVASIGCAYYFNEAGGLAGMTSGQYPLWYEFMPSHFMAGLLGGYFAAKRAAPPELSA